MKFPELVAHVATHRVGRVYAAVGVIVALCVAAVVFLCRLDSEVLNLLPAKFESVETLKEYNREFSEGRQLTFAIYDESHTRDLDGFTEHFAAMLRQEPWVTRVMEQSPMETPEGIQDVQTIALPLLLNLPAEEFASALTLLQPAQITARLARFRQELDAGSMRAELQMNFDPLGLLGRALKPLAGTFSADQAEPLTSPDGTLRLVLVVTNQTDPGAHACQRQMRQVADFKTRVLASWKNDAPEILVTGRTAYVAEMSQDMRKDIVSTVLGSIGLVALIFYAGFRRVRPLIAIMHALLLCCIVAVGLGTLIFRELNMITIGFCSILIGLGVDFGMLLYGAYASERNDGVAHEPAIAAAVRQLGGGVFFGALTTAAGFLSLMLSETRGFTQLGVLIAIGIMAAALFMTTVFFVFIGSKSTPRQHDWFFHRTKDLVGYLTRAPRPVLIATTVLLGALTAYAFLPFGQIKFEGNPRSLEPPDSKAGYALRKIQEKIPAAGEPILVLVKARDAEEFATRWSLLHEHWRALRDAGEIKNFSSPGPFALSPQRIQTNIAKLPAIDLPAARETLTKAVTANGYSANAFPAAFSLIDSLESIARGNLIFTDWRKALPENSSWWFILDRFFSGRGDVGAAYVTPSHKITNEAEKDALNAKLAVPGVPMRLTGWSYTIADLIPWSHDKLILLSTVMVVFNIALLVFLYRAVGPLLVLMLSLALSVGAMVACLKIFHITLNLFNVLAFPLVLAVGVDYGIYIVLALRQAGDRQQRVATITKPVLMSGLTTVAGFGSLGFAHNPSLAGLGIVCALGVAWCLFSTLFFILPAYLWRGYR